MLVPPKVAVATIPPVLLFKETTIQSRRCTERLRVQQAFDNLRSMHDTISQDASFSYSYSSSPSASSSSPMASSDPGVGPPLARFKGRAACLSAARFAFSSLDGRTVIHQHDSQATEDDDSLQLPFPTPPPLFSSAWSRSQKTIARTKFSLFPFSDSPRPSPCPRFRSPPPLPSFSSWPECSETC